MYYKRFTQKDLDSAIAKEVITNEHIALILNFYEKNVFALQGILNVEKLLSVIPETTQIDYDANLDLYLMQVREWPYLKPMCLKFAPQKPYRWIYITEDDNRILFHYHLDTYSIHLPSD